MGPSSRASRRGTNSQQVRGREEERVYKGHDGQRGRGSSRGEMDRIRELENKIEEMVAMMKATTDQGKVGMSHRKEEACATDSGGQDNLDKTEHGSVLKQWLETRDHKLREKEREVLDKDRQIEKLQKDLQEQQAGNC